MKKFILTITIGILTLTLGACAKNWQCDKSGYAKKGTVLVAGATGRTGRLIVEQLLTEGYTVRAFVRNQEKAIKLFGDRVEIAVGDVRDSVSIDAAMQGIRWVYSAIGAGGSKDPGNLPEFVDYGGTKSLVEAALKEDVKRFIMVSSRSAGKVDHFLNKRHHNVLLWKKKAEDFLVASGLNYTIVRPGGLNDDAGGQHAIIAFEPNRDDIKLRRISRADVATVCVKSLRKHSAFRKTFAIVNDPDAKPESWKAFYKTIKQL